MLIFKYTLKTRQTKCSEGALVVVKIVPFVVGIGLIFSL
jgi:hypothetical protein